MTGYGIDDLFKAIMGERHNWRLVMDGHDGWYEVTGLAVAPYKLEGDNEARVTVVLRPGRQVWKKDGRNEP